MNLSQGPHYIDGFITFTVDLHNAATGNSADGDSDPTWRLYEDETGTAILNGTMAKLDDSNTLGFYSERVQMTAASGFEVNKTYTVRVQATVDGVTGAQSGSFKVSAPLALASVVDAIKAVTDAFVAAQSEPSGVPAADETPLDKLAYMYAALRNKVRQTGNKKQFYSDADAVLWEKDVTNISEYVETKGNAP